jgi:hypothetical protein
VGVVAGYIEVEDLKAMYRELGMQVNDLDIKNMIAGIVTVRLRISARWDVRSIYGPACVQVWISMEMVCSHSTSLSRL